MASTSVTAAHDSPAALRTLLLRLKDETRDVHQSLEKDLDLLRPGLTLERYRSIIERFYGFHHPWERAIEPLLVEYLPEFQDTRRKSPRLLEDLKFLGANSQTLPLCKQLPDCAAWPSVLGSLYVTEGATLGGQVISRGLSQSLGLSPRAGISFFWSYGMEVGTMWRRFCDMLISKTQPGQEETIVAAARGTFTAMHAWLCRP